MTTGVHKVLHAAIESGKHLAVDECIRTQPFRLDDRDEFGRTALHVAVESGDSSIVRKLIKGLDGVGADVHARTFFGLTPLHVAAATGQNAIAVQLIAAGAERLAVTDFNATALDLAELHGHQAVALTLRRLNVPPSRGWALLPRKIDALARLCQELGHEGVAKSLGLNRERLGDLLQGPARFQKT